jgi:hypothetical protein
VNNSLNIAPEIDLQLLLDQRDEAKAREKDAKADVDNIDEAIRAEMIARGVTTLQVGDRPISLRFVSGRKTLDKLKLASLGVATDIIQQATVEGQSSTRLDVGKAK